MLNYYVIYLKLTPCSISVMPQKKLKSWRPVFIFPFSSPSDHMSHVSEGPATKMEEEPSMTEREINLGHTDTQYMYPLVLFLYYAPARKCMCARERLWCVCACQSLKKFFL